MSVPTKYLYDIQTGIRGHAVNLTNRKEGRHYGLQAQSCNGVHLEDGNLGLM